MWILSRLRRLLSPDGAAASPPGAPAAEDRSPLPAGGLADVATGLWRTRLSMHQPGSTEPREEMRRPYRHVESTWAALAQLGVEVQDHTGLSYDAGLSLKVLAFQPTAGLSGEVVIETIKPTVYLRGERIQVGEVIVGIPPTETPTAGGGDGQDHH